MQIGSHIDGILIGWRSNIASPLTGRVTQRTPSVVGKITKPLITKFVEIIVKQGQGQTTYSIRHQPWVK